MQRLAVSMPKRCGRGISAPIGPGLGALDAEHIEAMRAERDALDPFVLSAAIEAKVRRILAGNAEAAPRRTPRKPLSWDQQSSSKGARREAEQAAAPVRSYVAR